LLEGGEGQDEETAIQASDGTGLTVTWSGPPLMPTLAKERFHSHLAPGSGTSAQAALDQLFALGATRLDIGHGCPGAIVLADVDGNELCLVEQWPPVQDLHAALPCLVGLIWSAPKRDVMQCPRST
jgi:hypothetical protein